MSDPTNATGGEGGDPDAARDYDAFLSYAHRDQEVAAAIQKALHSIGRRLGQLRALRVFRDTTNLEANPDLWAKITSALDGARYLIVVLSPQAAASVWVDKEVSYWLEDRGREQLMLVVAEGDLQWDEAEARFDPQRSNAALPVLTQGGTLPAEPLYIDVSHDAPWDFRSQIFRDKVTALAAPIHGRPKDQLASDDLREQQRFRRFRAAAFAGLALLTVIAVVAAVIAFVQRGEAVRERQEAIQQRDAATALKLTSQGQAMLAGVEGGGDVRAIQQILAAARIAAGSDNGVQLTAVVERQDTIKIIQPPQGSVLAFSRDGRRLVYYSGKDTHFGVQLWDTGTRKPIGQPITASGIGVAFSADGHRVAVADFDHTVQLRNADTGQLIGPLATGLDPVMGVVFSPDGHRIVAYSSDMAQIWNADTDQPIGQPLTKGGIGFGSMTFSPDGHVIAASDYDSSVRQWNVDTGQPVGQPLTGAGVNVNNVTFSPDGHVIAAGDYEGTVWRWNADTGQPIGQPLTGHTAQVNSVAFSPDGHRLVSGSSDRTVRLWNANTGQPIGDPLTGHTDSVSTVTFSPDGGRALSAGEDGTLRIWDPAPDRPLQSGLVQTVAFSQDGRRFFAADSDSNVWTWDTNARQQIGPPRQGPGTYAGTTAISPDGRRIVSEVDDTLLMWDAATGRQIGPPLTGSIGGRGLAFSADGRRVADRGLEDLRLWNAVTGQQIGPPLMAKFPHKRVGPNPFGVTFSPDGHRIASGGDGVGVWLWNTDTGQQIAKPAIGGATTTVAFSPDGHRVVSGDTAKMVRLWNADNGKAIGPPLDGSNDTVTCVVFSPDGHVIVSGSADGMLRLWNAGTGQQIGPPLTGHIDAARPLHGVNSVAFSPDGRWFGSGGEDEDVRLWPGPAIWPEVLCNKLTANMSHKQWHEWVSPDIPYITVCPGLPIAPD
jgi:WD40 repeat protein